MRYDKINMGWSIVLILCISIITGCHNFQQAFGSKNISSKRLLFIPRQGSLHLRWEARHLTIEFKGKVNQNMLTANGTIDITSSEIQHFSMLSQLVVDIYFTNSTGNVLDKQIFYSVEESPLKNATPRAFKRSFKLPEKTSHIAFGYDGTAREYSAKTLQKKGHTKEHAFQHSPFR